MTAGARCPAAESGQSSNSPSSVKKSRGRDKSACFEGGPALIMRVSEFAPVVAGLWDLRIETLPQVAGPSFPSYFSSNADNSRSRQSLPHRQDSRMVPGLRPFLIVLCLGLGISLWWMSGQYQPASAPAGEGKGKSEAAAMTVWTAETPVGSFWGNESKKVVEFDGLGVGGKGKAIKLTFDGPGWRGCGLNWKGWYPADACDDVSKYRSLVFQIRQVTTVADADLAVRLVDNLKRPDDKPASSSLSVLTEGGLSRIDGEWRRVVLPLARFSRGTDLDLKRIWGIDFFDSSERALTFQIDGIGFSDDMPASPRFPPAANYSATARVAVDQPGHAIRDEITGASELPPDMAAA